MGVLDDIRREFTRALEQAQRVGAAGPPGPAADRRPGQAPDGPKPTRNAERPGDVTQPTAPTQRGADGRLQRESLQRTAPPAISPEPSSDDFRRKVAVMAAGEPEPMGALPAPDVSPPHQATVTTPGPFTLAARDMLRAVLLVEVLDEPKGRRARRPHPK